VFRIGGLVSEKRSSARALIASFCGLDGGIQLGVHI
jgi:hypothetical protein